MKQMCNSGLPPSGAIQEHTYRVGNLCDKAHDLASCPREREVKQEYISDVRPHKNAR